MIALATEGGKLLRLFSPGGELVFHPAFGFVEKQTIEQRNARRRRQGLAEKKSPVHCSFQIKGSLQNWTPQAVSGCQVQKADGGKWKLVTDVGSFWLSDNTESLSPIAHNEEERTDRTFIYSLLVSCLLLTIAVIPTGTNEVAAPIMEEPVTVNIPLETQKAVKVPEPSVVAQMPKLESKAQNNKPLGGAQVQQNLGFISLLGKKDLKKAMGGMPTEIKDASPGAGAGGKEGSGGELLVGLGQGVKRTTVGNSGVAGLGGIGNKGAGGGGGGFGNSLVGSGGSGTGLIGPGEGKRISAMALSNDIVLDGGLDQSVIQATIAKYLSQVRACYEQQLTKNPALNGQVTMAFEINGRGNLNYSKVARTTLGNGDVESCIATRMMTWKFPEPLGGVNVKVSYPFLLRPVRG